jgi:hypothetical protein
VSLQAFGSVPSLGNMLATTPAAGFSLVNGTPNILTWTAPADGQLHQVVVISSMDVTTATTGGAILATITMPDGTQGFITLQAGTQPAGYNYNSSIGQAIVEAGSTVTVSQSSAMTAGAAKVWARIFGS